MKKSLLQAQKSAARVFGCIGLVLAASLAHAQVSTYTYASENGTYTEITGGLMLGDANNDDDVFVNPAQLSGTPVAFYATGPGLPIGFGFRIQDRIYTKLAVNSNGWINLGRNNVIINDDARGIYNFSNAVVDSIPVICGFANDLEAKPTSTLLVQTNGAVGSRICTIQWKNYNFYNVSPSENYNFQIQLHEAGNKIVLQYGSIVANMDSTDYDSERQVGIKGFSNADVHLRSGTYSSNMLSSNPLVAVLNVFSTNKPANGQKLTFAPALPCGQRPVAAFSTNVVAGGVQFANTSVGADSYVWNFGAGATPATLTTTSSAPVTVSYTTSGSKTVVLRAIKLNCSDSVLSRQIVVCTQRPIAAFAINIVAGGYQFVSSSVGADTLLWNFGAGATPATLKTISSAPVLVSYTTSGSKTVVLRAIKANCTDSILTRQIVVTSSKTALSQAQVKTYPNPASKQLFVENNTNTLLSLQLFDIIGHKVLEVKDLSQNTKSQLDIASLLPGIYILQLQTSQGVRSQKIVVQR